jgi:hypothetical protein
MSQMLELIRQNAVPAAVMRSAAKGALSIAPAEMLQILVHLTTNQVFSKEAKMTLAGWDSRSAAAVLSGDNPPKDVVEYFWSKENRRTDLMPALIETSATSEQKLAELAIDAPPDLVSVLLASPRVQNCPAVLQNLLENYHLVPAEAQEIKNKLGLTGSEPVDPEVEAAHNTWTREHSAEMAAEEGRAFELTGDDDDLAKEETASQGEPQQSVPTAASQKALQEPEKISTLVKISRMNVAQRVKTAFLGNKEERMILIRDASKVVQNAVLSSPKLSDPEVELFAAAKNVNENVLREISRNRRFMKSYNVMRNLATNPRCPLDLSLTLIKNLLVFDLKSLRQSKNVPDTLRKVADKLYREKMTPSKQG